ncbi:MAG: GNAT family N-acetyltransferase [Myxococcales bacterium]|nr:GNAT family N-acetyltransferase [Myxococcales bacterium]
MVNIRTRRALLRRARESDLEAFFSIMSDDETMRYWSTPPHRSIETTRAWLRSMLDADPAASDEFVIEYEGAVVGKVGAYRLPEIGFILRRDLWGKGIMTEATAALIEHVFRTRDVTELVADVDPRNVGSLRVLARLGFVEYGRAERTYCIDGTWTDSVYLRRRRDADTTTPVP